MSGHALTLMPPLHHGPGIDHDCIQMVVSLTPADWTTLDKTLWGCVTAYVMPAYASGKAL